MVSAQADLNHEANRGISLMPIERAASPRTLTVIRWLDSKRQSNLFPSLWPALVDEFLQISDGQARVSGALEGRIAVLRGDRRSGLAALWFRA